MENPSNALADLLRRFEQPLPLRLSLESLRVGFQTRVVDLYSPSSASTCSKRGRNPSLRFL
jgi:hypothetical protein